jgi:SAM-dependent methyltransferase
MLELLVLIVIYFGFTWFGASPFQLLFAFCVWGIFAMPGAWMMFRGAPPLVPTSRKTVQRMVEFANIKPGETAYDVGCGDGRIVFAAAAKGARAIGYEFSLLAFLLAWVRSLFHRGAHIRFANFWKKDFRDADVVFCYLLVGLMGDFKEIIWSQLKPGTRVVSHTFRLPGVEPTRSEEGVHLYIKE